MRASSAGITTFWKLNLLTVIIKMSDSCCTVQCRNMWGKCDEKSSFIDILQWKLSKQQKDVKSGLQQWIERTGTKMRWQC